MSEDIDIRYLSLLIICTCPLIPEVGKGKHRPLVQ